MKIIILGAKGRFGSKATAAAIAAGHQVIAFARDWTGAPTVPGAILTTGDARASEQIISAAQGADLILDATNPPYGTWHKTLPPLTRAVIAAAKSLGARVLIPGNIYTYGKTMPHTLSHAVTPAPSNAMGRARFAAEQQLRASGVAVTILRGGDFLDSVQTGNWFDTHMTAKLNKGKFIYPGPVDQPHAFAYLPDMARALVDLGVRSLAQDTPIWQDIGFQGYTLTGAQLQNAVAQAIETPLKTEGVPWPILRAMGLFSAQMRGVTSMAYIWRRPHQIDGTAFDKVLPNFEGTPRGEAFADMVPKLMAA